MKKLFVLMFVMIFLVGTVSAFEFDNVLDYENNDLKVRFTNAFGFGEDLGTSELASHSSITEVKNIMWGEEQVVMYYDNNFESIQQLGEVYFTDMRTGEEIDKDYTFVIWEEVEFQQETVRTTCGIKVSYSDKTVCRSVPNGSYTDTRFEWVELEKNQIPEGTSRIGLKTYVGQNDWVDGVWTIAGKKVEKHITWSGNIESSIFAYYEMENDGGGGILQDATDSFNGTETAIVFNATAGVINNGSAWAGGTDEMDISSFTFDWNSNDWSIGGWIKGDAGLVHSGLFSNFFSASGGSFRLGIISGAIKLAVNEVEIYDGIAVNDNVYRYWVATYDVDTTNFTFFINSEQVFTTSSHSAFGDGTSSEYLGVWATLGQNLNGFMDEVMFNNATLSQAEITFLNESYEAGCGYLDDSCFINLPNVILDSPVDNTNFTLTNQVVMNATIWDSFNITNVTLYLDDVGNETNTTAGTNNSLYTFTKIMGDGDTSWTMEACNFNNTCGNASSRTYNVNTTPDIQFGAGVPVNYFNTTDDFFEVNVTLTENLFNNITFDLYNRLGTLNETVTFTNSSREKVWGNLLDGDYSYNVTTATTTNQFNSTGTRNISIDATSPLIDVFFPNETITFHKINTPLFVNWSVNDTNLDVCILQFQGVNTTQTCSDNQTTIDINNSVNRSLTFYANDTLGNIGSTNVSWNYRLFQESETFVSTILTGGTSVFSINFTTNGSDITIGNLSYNASGNIGTIVSSGNSFEINRTIFAPAVTVDSNVSFFWNITQSGGFTFSTTSQNQSVTAFGIDACSINTEVLYNFTIVDEKTQVKLVEATQNTTGDLNLQIFNFGTRNLITNFSNAYTSNSFSVCLNDSLSGGEKFSIDVQVQYSADDYAKEFFHIQNDTLNNADFPTNITLFDLDNVTSQEFSISFKNEDFLAVEDALIQIQRRYISEGVFKTVEIPKTDTDGETIAHLELQDVVYTFIVVKNGLTLATFNNVLVECNPLLQTCKLNLNSVSSQVDTSEFTSVGDLTYTLTFDKDTRTIESIWLIPTGTVGTVSLNATLLDALGTTQVCSAVPITSSSGTLSCIVPSNFGNASVFVELFLDDVSKGYGTIPLDQEAENIFGANLVFLLLFLNLTLIGVGISDNPMIMGVFLIFGSILAIALNLVDATGFVGEGATVLWFFIAVVLVLIKGAKRN